MLRAVLCSAATCLSMLVPCGSVAAGSRLADCVSPPDRDCAIGIVLGYVDATPYREDVAGLLARVGVALAKAGKPDAADRAFSRAVDAALAIEAPSTSYFTLRVIAQQQREAGRDTESRKTLALAAHMLIDDPGGTAGSLVTSQTMALRSLAEDQRAFGDDAGAAEALAVAARLAKTLGDAEERANELARVAAQQMLIGDQQEAADASLAAVREAISGLADPVRRATSLASLAAIQADAGRDEAARASLVEAYAISEEVAAPLDRGRLQAQLALTLLTLMTE